MVQHRSDFFDFLSTTTFFGAFPQQKMEVLNSFMYPRFFEEGDVVYKDGDQGDLLGIVHYGVLKREVPKTVENKTQWPVVHLTLTLK